MNIKISFHGAAQSVTGSQFLLQADDKKILIDCGLKQDKRKESYELNKGFRFPDKIKPSEIDAVVLTHAHIDHSGNLPTLAKHGFKGEIHATQTTVELCSYMLHDSAHLQDGDDVDNMLGQFVSHEYNETVKLSQNIKFRFHDAGHILGSAGV
jgi:metallo-beta-lactamase family protein